MSNIPKTDEAGIRQAIRALRKDGWELDGVHDGEECTFVKTEAEAVKAITAVDDSSLYVMRDARVRSLAEAFAQCDDSILPAAVQDLLDKVERY